jgi:N-acetylglucosaminyldiphosphoundecaprenol N-acetyl-beta-D-mannosaminyltransferase
MSFERIKILDIPFDRLTLKQALDFLLNKLQEKGHNSPPCLVATPNPEMLLAANKNIEFKKILQHTDLNIPDGFGIVLAAKLNGTPLLERVTGTDLMQALCANAPAHTKIFLLGAAEGIAEKVKKELESKYKINIVGTCSGSADPKDDLQIRQLINKSKPDMLFVAFGAPKQEFWLARNLNHLPDLKVAMGVGGAFDFIARVRKRAPAWMRQTGLEWLFRLIKQPSRISRIFNATVKFPLVFLISKLRKSGS